MFPDTPRDFDTLRGADVWGAYIGMVSPILRYATEAYFVAHPIGSQSNAILLEYTENFEHDFENVITDIAAHRPCNADVPAGHMLFFVPESKKAVEAYVQSFCEARKLTDMSYDDPFRNGLLDAQPYTVLFDADARHFPTTGDKAMRDLFALIGPSVVNGWTLDIAYTNTNTRMYFKLIQTLLRVAVVPQVIDVAMNPYSKRPSLMELDMKVYTEGAKAYACRDWPDSWLSKLSTSLAARIEVSGITMGPIWRKYISPFDPEPTDTTGIKDFVAKCRRHARKMEL